MDVIHHASQRRLVLDQLCLIASLKQLTPLVTKSVEAIGESPEQPMHSGGQIRLGGLQRQMEVVSLHNVSVNAPAVATAHLFQSCQKGAFAAGDLKNVASVIAAVNDVVKSVWEEEPKFTAHLPYRGASGCGYQQTNPLKIGSQTSPRPETLQVAS